MLDFTFVYATPLAPNASSAERCDVSLTEETTNTKHTHKRSKAQ